MTPGAVLRALQGYPPDEFDMESLKADKVYIAYAFLYCSELEVETGGNIGTNAGAKAQGGSLRLRSKCRAALRTLKG